MKTIQINRFIQDVIALENHLISNGYNVINISSSQQPPLTIVQLDNSENKNPTGLVNSFNAPVNQNQILLDQIKQKRINNQQLTTDEIHFVIDRILGIK